jgi:hypothetical protein
MAMTTKTGQEVFMVVGVDNNGMLVWTESFDIQGVFFDRAEADKYCEELNESDDEEDPDDRLEYEVYPLDVLTSH